MWIIFAITLHILLLGSIFIIYFRSPVISGLQAQSSLKEIGFDPPAKRLVLFVTDGLRAESFFRGNCSDVPHLRNLLLQKGCLVGVSHTHVPTESRPGHIALIAGLYEDPSAVTRGWKENPIDFDTVFNRSSRTYAWGANDVLHIFSRLNDGGRNEKHIFIEAYDHDLDFSGHDDTSELDNWVFDRVHKFLARKTEELNQQEQIVFFLHLLGLDSAGHIHKPGSKKFLQNLHNTERRIVEMYEKFEKTFPDGKTAYIVTSDHGMTDAGAHGAGAIYETETPFLLWGAGFVKEPSNIPVENYFYAGDVQRPRYNLEQAAFAPLMSALLGIPVPMNNFGILPLGFLNTSLAYESAAFYGNALQLIEQFQVLLKEHQRGLFSSYLRQFKSLNLDIVNQYKEKHRQLEKFGDFKAALRLSQEIMDFALEGIDYYHGYYRNVLLGSTTATFIGWIFYLLQLLVEEDEDHRTLKYERRSNFNKPLIGFCGFLIMIMLLQRVPFTVMLYILLPGIVWLIALEKRQQSKHFVAKRRAVPVQQLILIILSAEFLVYTFFQRYFISFAFLLYELMENRRNFTSKGTSFYIWMILTFILATFPLLPPSVGYKNDWLVCLGIVLVLFRVLFFAKARLGSIYKIINILAFSNALVCIYQHANNTRISMISQCVSWSFLVYAFASISLNKSASKKQRLELIFFNLTSVYSLLCTSYETIFILMLSTNVLLPLSNENLRQLSNLDLGEKQSEPYSVSSKSSAAHLLSTFRLSFAILLYTFFSFFGTGNIASVSSFDPNIIRCFLTTFSPFIIMALVILKLIIPIILNITIIYGTTKLRRERDIFICLLIICDIMGLNFLFFVKNRGSWLDIGSSISHFVIMEVTTLVLLLLTILSKLLLRLPISFLNIKSQ